MYINSEGIIFRQVKTAGGRKMILLFTRKYGKISAGSNISEKGKSKSSLAMHPFTYGVYELYKNRDYYNINSAEVMKSFFKIGEDVDKYMSASFILELTEKLVPEEMPQVKIFDLLIEFLQALTEREKRYDTLILAYEVKAMHYLGAFPELKQCCNCGTKEELSSFSVKDGGILCNKCRQKSNDSLIYDVKFDIVNILEYFQKRPLNGFGKIALDEGVGKSLQTIMRNYMSYHFDIGKLKSETFFQGKF